MRKLHLISVIVLALALAFTAWSFRQEDKQRRREIARLEAHMEKLRDRWDNAREDWRQTELELSDVRDALEDMRAASTPNTADR